MEHRIFGRDVTNLPDQDHLRAKRNHSFLHNDRLRDPKATISSRNRSLIAPALRPSEPRLDPTDPQMVPEYFQENLAYLRAQESVRPVLGNYICQHRTMSEGTRGKLVDWLEELHYKYRMFPETIFTVVGLLDRYFAVKAVPLGDLQLVGISALMIAAKFEETYQVPQMRQLLHACAGQYTAAQLLNTEADMLDVFNFELIVNSSYKFFEPLAKVAGLQPKNMHLGQYVLELALTKARFLEYKPSLMGAAAIYLIKKIRKVEHAWGEGMTKLTGYKESELKSCAKDLCSLLEEAPNLDNCKALKKKFSLPAYHEVTKIKLQRKDVKK